MSARTICMSAAALLLLAACDRPTEPASAPVEAEPVSVLRNAPEFASCKWETVTGKTLSIQAFACGPEFGRQHVEADDALPGFVLVTDGEDGAIRQPVIRVFAKDGAAPIDAVLPALRAASPGRDTATCALEPAPNVDPALKRYVLTPVGPAKAAWEKTVASDEPQDQPCGPLGVGIVGDRYAFELPGRPDRVVLADMGSEIQIFDPLTIRVVAP